MNSAFQNALKGFLREGDEDYIGLWEISSEISKIIGINDFKLSPVDSIKLLDALCEFATLMLQNGFIATSVQKVGTEKKYVTWPDQSSAYVTERIRSEWARLKGQKPDVNFIVYFDKTNKTPVKRDRSGKRIYM